jgi:flagellar basal body-associated protein FliL
MYKLIIIIVTVILLFALAVYGLIKWVAWSGDNQKSFFTLPNYVIDFYKYCKFYVIYYNAKYKLV